MSKKCAEIDNFFERKGLKIHMGNQSWSHILGEGYTGDQLVTYDCRPHKNYKIIKNYFLNAFIQYQ
ncbi:hypothetical protein BpHYR1_030787 [Brachionus plicatilis]|uniref:Uncharacterized protein n=1 Tax=Brachionus plicatilis TaxID=10195 RepID=A0A3M7RIX6_BRAPC|nr:hypothetical protein BpHYR1_030787 [Brachionus plicatilis]